MSHTGSFGEGWGPASNTSQACKGSWREWASSLNLTQTEAPTAQCTSRNLGQVPSGLVNNLVLAQRLWQKVRLPCSDQGGPRERPAVSPGGSMQISVHLPSLPR